MQRPLPSPYGVQDVRRAALHTVLRVDQSVTRPKALSGGHGGFDRRHTVTSTVPAIARTAALLP